jgi:uncharacterized protein (TIGR02145 family)/uncharacterized repeat protein (TIGR02543 family)
MFVAKEGKRKPSLFAVAVFVLIALSAVWFCGCTDKSISEALAMLGNEDVGTTPGTIPGQYPGTEPGTGTRYYTLTARANPVAGGTVSREPNYTSYEDGTSVTVTATAANGYAFTGWSGASTSTSSSVSITMDGNKTVTANFTKQTYTLTTSVQPSGWGTVSLNPSRSSYDAGTSVTATATAASGYTFTGWSGASTSTSSSVTVTVDGNKTLTANFSVMPTPGDTGRFTDGRDNQTYKTIKVGNQSWMAENLNYDTESGSWCYGGKADSCAKYGRLYDWNTAKTVCPVGWHLPSRDEWGTLAKTAGGTGDYGAGGTAGKKLKSKSGWNNSGNGTDDYGFSALPGGYRYSDGSFGNAGNYGNWWAATEDGSSNAYDRNMYCNGDRVYEPIGDKSNGFSVRCVRD